MIGGMNPQHLSRVTTPPSAPLAWFDRARATIFYRPDIRSVLLSMPASETHAFCSAWTSRVLRPHTSRN